MLRCALVFVVLLLLLPADYGTTPHGVQDTTVDVDGSYHGKQNHRQVRSGQLGMAWLSSSSAMPCQCHAMSGRLARSHGEVCI
jgi:hypothetical protein